MVVIYGIHAVSEALKSGARSFDYVGIARERHDQRMQRIIDDCRASGVQVRFLPREELDQHRQHQYASGRDRGNQQQAICRRRHAAGAAAWRAYSFLVVLDGIEDPHNLGALIRSADGAGLTASSFPIAALPG